MNKHTLHHARGAALLLFMLFFVMASVGLTLAFGRSFYSDLVSYRLLSLGAQSFYTAEAGVEDMAYRFIDGMTVGTSEVLVLAGATATTTYAFDGASDRYDILASSTYNRAYKTSQLSLYLGAGASFNFGVQSGNGGFTLTNGSSVSGNVFSNGSIIKTGGGNATISGDAISAGPTGRIEDARVLGTARAHFLEDNYIAGNAHYVSDSGSTVVGTRYTPATDELPTTMPITDAKIDAIKLDITTNGSLIAATDPLCSTGTYVISADTTLNSSKIECDLEVVGNNTDLTLTGSLWVAGDIRFRTGPNIIIDSSAGDRTVPIVAEDPSDVTNSGKIVIENSTSFTGLGTPKSYILLISQNRAAENGTPGVSAIEVQQSSYGDLLVYAAHGKITMGNSASLKEVTGYHIELGNNAVITYESGLVNLLFTSGPGGGFTLNGWQER